MQKEDTVKVLREDIKSKNFKRVYLLYGEEDYLVKSYRDALKKAVLADASEDNYTYFNGTNFDVNELMEMAVTYPFFADRRIIVLENGESVAANDEFAEFLGNIPDTTVLVITQKSADKRTKLYKKVKEVGYPCEFTKMTPEDTVKFAAGSFAKRGLRITENNCSYFVERIGGDLYTVATEVEKLSSYCYGKSVVEKEDIEAVCTLQIENRIFELVDALIAGNREEALAIYFDLIALRESPLRLLRFIMSQYNRLFTVLSGIKTGCSDAEIASFAKQPEWAIKKYRAKLRGCSVNSLTKALKACADCEESIKTGNISEEIGMEMLLEELSQSVKIS